MSTSAAQTDARAQDVRFTDDEMVVALGDGRKIVVPLRWFPRLLHASARQRDHWQLVGEGHGIHWPDLDEDVSVRGFVRGSASVEANRRGRHLG